METCEIENIDDVCDRFDLGDRTPLANFGIVERNRMVKAFFIKKDLYPQLMLWFLAMLQFIHDK